jgi:hypothetical protein
MKKLIICLIAVAISTTFIMAKTPSVNEKVLKAFALEFPKVDNPSWQEYDNYYEVYFDNNDIKCRIRYDLDGNVLSIRRDYYEANLSPFVRAKVNEKYPGKKIFGITEMTSGEEMRYLIILEDEKHWYNIKSDATGQLFLEKKLNKAGQ